MDTGTWVRLGTDQTPNIPAPLTALRLKAADIGRTESSGVTTAEVGRAPWQDVAP